MSGFCCEVGSKGVSWNHQAPAVSDKCQLCQPHNVCKDSIVLCMTSDSSIAKDGLMLLMDRNSNNSMHAVEVIVHQQDV